MQSTVFLAKSGEISNKDRKTLFCCFLTKLYNWNNISFNEAGELPLRSLKHFTDAIPLILLVFGTWHLKHYALCKNKKHTLHRERIAFQCFPVLNFKMGAALLLGFSYIKALDTKIIGSGMY